MGKIKYNPSLVKKVIVLAIILLVVVLFAISMVRSFTNYRHTTTGSVELDTKIPAGEYQTYIKRCVRPGWNESRLRLLDLESDYNQQEYQKLHVKKNQFAGVTLKGTDAINGIYDATTKSFVEESPDFIQNWPTSDEDKTAYGALLNGDTGVFASETGGISFKFNVPTKGFYNIKIKYFIPKGKGSNVEKGILLNGKSIFNDLDDFKFYRLYHDSGTITQDIKGNDLKPSQTEIYEYRETYLIDSSGYINEPYLILINAGENVITFKGIRDDVVITEFQVLPTDANEILTYEEYYDKYTLATGLDENSVTGVLTRYEAEDSERRYATSPTLYASSDRTSAESNPVDPVKTKYNAVGGSKWSTVGDTIYWDIDVKEDGFYGIAFRSKQDLSRGLFSTRKLLVDNELPFSEAANCRFYYDSNYSIASLGGADGTKYYVYLTAGKHSIALQATLGSYAEALSRVQEVINDLNDLYLRIIVITSANPDDYQDYKLYGDNPSLANDALGRNMQEIFNDCAQELYYVSQLITELTGEKSSLNNTLDKLVLQMGGNIDTDGDGTPDKDYGGFASKPRNVTKDLGNFKTNLSSLGTWMLDIKSQTLTIESFYGKRHRHKRRRYLQSNISSR